MSHSISQLTSRVSRLVEQVQRAGIGACPNTHKPMPLIFVVREGDPYPVVPERPTHCECGHPLRDGPTTIHRILARG